MFRFYSLVISLLLLISSSASAANSLPAANATPLDKQAVEKIIHDYLLQNPEILVEAAQALQKKQLQQQKLQQQDLIKRHAAKLFFNPGDPVAGNPKSKQVIVEFFDYNCGYCKRMNRDTQSLLKSKPNIRYVYKEYPILSQSSMQAARAALAVHQLYPGKYMEFRNLLLSQIGNVSEKTLPKSAKELGLDWGKIQEAMDSDAVKKQLSENIRLAGQLGIRGTPTFVIGNTIYRGIQSEKILIKALKEASSKS
ncbi:DsbA family protein [Dongshaea marina]|uniref:DsbA family protein n=1 Tax=Dongshaea marina TaxID=2047966 RepID=UPI000D3EBE35|nr:DsbA family protein [Dongshaea marina]